MHQPTSQEMVTFRQDDQMLATNYTKGSKSISATLQAYSLFNTKRIPRRKRLKEIKLVEVRKPKEGDIDEVKMLDDFEPVPRK